MKKIIKKILFVFLFALAIAIQAKEPVRDKEKKSKRSVQNFSYNCASGTSTTLLDVNNVKTSIMNGGDMWWDLQGDARYEIPIGSGKHSLFAGALWIGGKDDNNQLKVAAQTYRSSGDDFWPGPLDNVRLTSDGLPNSNYGKTDASVCAKYDEHFVLLRSDVEDFVGWWNSDKKSVDYPDYIIPSSILNYPGNRSSDDFSNAFSGKDTLVASTPYYSLETLAPFRDVDGDGKYNPLAGDHPEYNLDGSLNCKEDDMLFGDQTLWWVYNDAGNTHTASGSASAIGLEIQAQAFAFSTNDEINNMTFYNYRIINRSHSALNETWFGQFVDPDLGNYDDDFVGCDVSRGLGYCYNGDEDDEGAKGYGANPPAIGVDFFRGPLADEDDGVDNNRNGIIDEAGEQITMSKFVYYNRNTNVTNGEPDIASDFYNYLRGIWKDGSSMTYGGDGTNPSNVACDFMFPGDSDPKFQGQSWTEQSAGNVPDDRRFVQSAGPFTLEPGAVNNVTTGVVWARASQGGAWASVEQMLIADDKAQKLFDVCFEVLDGPDAPDLTIQELNQELVVMISNDFNSNNYKEEYVEVDEVNIIGYYDSLQTLPYDNEYVFEGYQIFQLRDETVTASDVYNVDKARLVFQSDVKNYRTIAGQITSEETDHPISRLINFEYSQDLQASIPKDMTLEDVGSMNQGIKHSVSITEDLFAVGNRTLVNHKTYYYTAIAYAYNQYLAYAPDQVPDASNLYAPSFKGQKKPFLAGRKNIKQYSVIPHRPDAEADGTLQNVSYGTIPSLTRLKGIGNGGMSLEFTPETKAIILSEFCDPNTTYAENTGPVNITVVDPLNVPENTEFIFKMNVELNDTLFLVADSSSYILPRQWILVNSTLGDTVYAEQTIEVNNEQLIPEWGLSLAIENGEEVGRFGDDKNSDNGFLSASMLKADDSDWLDYVYDNDYFSMGNQAYISHNNWIRSGIDTVDHKGLDDGEAFEGILNGAWAPYRLVGVDGMSGAFEHSPAYKSFQTLNKLKDLPSVDIVFTSDQSLWTRCPVIETQSGSNRLYMKSEPSVDKGGNADDSGTQGFSWFPGYALDLEKGTRLNLMFGESSSHPDDNGSDMMWNPTSTLTEGDSLASIKFNADDSFDVIFGGRHYVYVMKNTYAGPDEKQNPLYSKLTKMNSIRYKREVFREVAWVSIPLLAKNTTRLSSDVEIKLRVSKPYQRYEMEGSLCEQTGSSDDDGGLQMKFNTKDIQTVTKDVDVARKALDLIRVVPNPYYGSNNYEKDQLDHRVRITNLPKICKISIYNVSGTLVRQVKLDSEQNTVGWDWDLKNDYGVSISSGVYIIHVDAHEKGEKVVKWFGALRPIDLDSF
jgi:hypothetical protein